MNKNNDDVARSGDYNQRPEPLISRTEVRLPKSIATPRKDRAVGHVKGKIATNLLKRTHLVLFSA